MFSCVIPVYLTVFKRQTMHGHRGSLLGFFAKARPSRALNDVVSPGRDSVSSQRNSQFNGQFVSHTDLIELEVNSPVFFLHTQTRHTNLHFGFSMNSFVFPCSRRHIQLWSVTAQPLSVPALFAQ